MEQRLDPSVDCERKRKYTVDAAQQATSNRVRTAITSEDSREGGEKIRITGTLVLGVGLNLTNHGILGDNRLQPG